MNPFEYESDKECPVCGSITRDIDNQCVNCLEVNNGDWPDRI